MGVEFIKVVTTQLTITGPCFQHMVDDHRQRVSHRQDISLLVSAAYYKLYILQSGVQAGGTSVLPVQPQTEPAATK